MPEFVTTPAQAEYARQIGPYLASMTELARRLTMREIRLVLGAGPEGGSIDEALRALVETIQTSQARADLLGRAETLRKADQFVRAGSAAPAGSGITIAPPGPTASIVGDLPRVPFTDAVADIIAREPRLAVGYREVAKAYNEGHAFALARSTMEEVTTRVQAAVADAVASGQTASGLARDIQAIAEAAGEDMTKWTRSYAETVARTNMATAYSAGEFRQMADPAVRYAIGALRYTAIKDSSTRPNHAAADGIIAAPDWEGWHRFTAPLGYNCRCGMDPIGWPELERMGRVKNGKVTPPAIPAGAGPDPGFVHTGRPDIAIYGGTI